VAISPGNSGGGLFNTNGELIGIVNAKSVSENVEGIGFAIPIDIVRMVAQQLIEQGYVTGRAQLGIKCVSIDSVQKAWNYNVTSFGVLVQEAVEENAKAAGLQENDLIVAIDNNKIESLSALQMLLYGYEAGQQVRLTVLRNGQQVDINLTLSQKK
jgi:serine protease Do